MADSSLPTNIGERKEGALGVQGRKLVSLYAVGLSKHERYSVVDRFNSNYSRLSSTKVHAHFQSSRLVQAEARSWYIYCCS